MQFVQTLKNTLNGKEIPTNYSLDPFLSCLRSFPLKLTNGSDANIDAIISPVHQECASLAKLPTQSADAMDAAAPSSSTLQSSGFTAQSRIAVFGLLLFMI